MPQITITQDYLDQLAPIYQDVLSAFAEFDPLRKSGYGLSYQSLYSALDGKYNLGAIRMACEEMEKGGAVEIKNEIFVHPTELGEELIAALTGGETPDVAVPPFHPPHI